MKKVKQEDLKNQLHAWFNDFWDESFFPEIEDIVAKEKENLVLAEGSKERVSKGFVTLWQYINDQMQKTKNGKRKNIDRHKIAACVAAAILHVRVLHRTEERPAEDWPINTFFANEILAFQCALNVMASFIIAGFENDQLKEVDPERIKEIREKGFKMPPTHEGSDRYDLHICRALRISYNLRESSHTSGIRNDTPSVDILLLSAILYHIELHNLKKPPIVTYGEDEIMTGP